MQDIMWLAGAVIVLMALWLVWTLSRNASKNADTTVVREPPPRVPPAPQPAAEPVDAAPAALPPADGPPDDLRQLKGVGPKLATLLGELGVTRYDQIAAFSDADVATLDAQLGTFQGRIARDNWIEQADLLARGETQAFEAKFGKLGG